MVGWGVAIFYTPSVGGHVTDHGQTQGEHPFPATLLITHKLPMVIDRTNRA